MVETNNRREKTFLSFNLTHIVPNDEIPSLSLTSELWSIVLSHMKYLRQHRPDLNETCHRNMLFAKLHWLAQGESYSHYLTFVSHTR